jgi:spermidine synthase
MAGMLPATLHPQPRTAMVIGLGTGSTAGWLAQVPSMEHVDVAELEPAVLEFARLCAPVNADAMSSPKVSVTIGDAREILMTSRRKYDLIVSEPSNPYRAGIASLFTREYYHSIASRLNDGGMFVQWVQAYSVDSKTIQTVYATLNTVFPHVETWMGCGSDLLLVASRSPIPHDARRLKARIATAPYSAALLASWRATDAEAFYAHFLANDSFARQFARIGDVELNTDDRSVIEFGFARSLNFTAPFSVDQVRVVARQTGQSRPATLNAAAVDWNRVDIEIPLFAVAQCEPPDVVAPQGTEKHRRVQAMKQFSEQNSLGALMTWKAQPWEPHGPVELAIVADALASAGDESAMKYVDELRKVEPVEADAIVALLRFRQNRPAESADALAATFTRFRQDPWANRVLMDRTLTIASLVAAHDPKLARQVYDAMSEPFAVYANEESRCSILLEVAAATKDIQLAARALERLEPYVPWTHAYLSTRAKVYAEASHPLRARALAELKEFDGSQVVQEDRLQRMAQSGAPENRGATAAVTRAE